MNIASTIKSLFISIAEKLGVKTQKKPDIELNYAKKGLNPTAIGAQVITNIAIDDSDIIITGSNARAIALREVAEYFSDDIRAIAAEVSLGTGDCIVRPFTDGYYIGLNVIGNDNFMVTESIGPHLKGVVIKLDEYKDDKHTYYLFESQTLKNIDGSSAVYIKRFAFKDEKSIDILATSWRDLRADELITADQLIIGRYKCPTINRDDYNSVNGVPITFGCEDIVDNVKNKYQQYNEEFDRKQSVIFADRTLFKTEKGTDGSTTLKFDGKDYIKVKTAVDGSVSDVIQDYSPAIREIEFQNANNFNLSILELCCGFSRGVFTSPETAFATATEMKNSLKKTFAFVKRFRRRLEAGDKMLFNAINILMNLNSLTPVGNYSLQHDWSYDYIEQTTERFNQLLQAHSAGVIKDETLCAWVNGLTQEDAKKYIAELKLERASTVRPENNDDDWME